PHRPSLAPALGLRAGDDGLVIISQTAARMETSTMLLPSWLGFRQTASPRRPAERHRGRRRPACRLQVEPLEDRCLLAAGLSATLVADINPGTDSSNPSFLTNVGGTLYFAAFNPNSGDGVWKNDGTASGTVLVKGNLNRNAADFTPMNGSVFWQNGSEIWKTDGTTAGTNLVISLSSIGDYLTP